MKHKKICTALSLSVLLGSCTMIPDFSRPGFSAADEWNTPDAVISEEHQREIQNIHWQEYFKSAELQFLIQIALENNKNLQIAYLNIEEARRIYRIERSNLFPNLAANFEAVRQQSSDESNIASAGAFSTEFYSAQFGITDYELDFFGRVQSLNEAALNDFFATSMAKDIVQNALIAEIANAYLQYLSDIALLDLTRKTLDAQQRTLDILTQSSERGIGTAQDVARAKTAVETARVNLYQYKRMLKQDENALSILLGMPFSEDLIPETQLSEIEFYNDFAFGLPSEVLLTRPDIREAEFALRARNADIGAARAAFFPRISLTGAYGFASNDLSNLFTSGAWGAWSFVPRITVPIFTAGRNQNNLDLAEIRKDRAIIQYEQAIQNAFREVSDALTSLQTLEPQLQAQNRLVEAANDVYTISNARFDAGIDNYLSVLDAQRELYIAQQEQIRLHLEERANRANLYKTFGGGVGYMKLSGPDIAH